MYSAKLSKESDNVLNYNLSLIIGISFKECPHSFNILRYIKLQGNTCNQSPVLFFFFFSENSDYYVKLDIPRAPKLLYVILTTQDRGKISINSLMIYPTEHKSRDWPVLKEFKVLAENFF